MPGLITIRHPCTIPAQHVVKGARLHVVNEMKLGWLQYRWRILCTMSMLISVFKKCFFL